MKVVLARTAGFCWGVRRAMDAVLEASAHGVRPVQTLGPLIHNPQALELIRKRGVATAESTDKVQKGTVVIRAHGIPIHELRHLKTRQMAGELQLVNATCPEVAKVHSRIKRYSPKGYFTVILGVHGHAESVAHCSFAEHGAAIVANLDEAKKLTDDQLRKVLVVAQTTFTIQDFDEISDYIRARSQDCIVENTICEDTWTRQSEAERITSMVDAVVVVGGRNSANTRHLVDLAARRGRPVQYVEVAAELDLTQFTGSETVGVLAGASTPTWLVEEVVDLLEQHGHHPGLASRSMFETFGTPVLLALGSGVASLGLLRWLGLTPQATPPLVAMGYVLAMYLLTPYLDPMGIEAKGPARARFLARHKVAILCLGSLSLLLALLLSLLRGPWPFLALAAASASGLLYKRTLRVGQLTLNPQAIPGSKDVLVALAMAVVLVMLPVLDAGQPFNFRALAATAFIAALAFARTTLHNLKEMQNDRILGQETLPILLGRKGAKIAMIAALTLALLPVLALELLPATRTHYGVLPVFILAAGLPPLQWWLYHERFTAGRVRFEAPLELAFFVLGLLAIF